MLVKPYPLPVKLSYDKFLNDYPIIHNNFQKGALIFIVFVLIIIILIIETFKYEYIILLYTMESKSVFVEYFGDYPLIRVLDFLILGRGMDYSMTEICKNSSVGWTAFSEIWPSLEKKDIVTFTRKIGNAKLYKLNTKNPWVIELLRMDKVITKLETKKALSNKQEVIA